MDNIQGSTGQNLAIPDEQSQAPVNLIPAELLKIIFSELDSSKDMQQLSLVNKKWNVEVVSCVKEKELEAAKTFMGKLIENMNKIATDGEDYDGMGLSDDDKGMIHYYQNLAGMNDTFEKKKQIEEAITQLKVNFFDRKKFIKLDLLEFKSALIETQEIILDVLKKLDDDVLIKLASMSKNENTPIIWGIDILSNLANTTKSMGFDDLFYLAFQYKEMERAKKLIDNYRYTYTLYRDASSPKGDLLAKIAENLMNHGHFDRAVKCALKISDMQHQSLILKNISKKLMDANYNELGMKVANLIHDPKIQAEVLEQISRGMNL